MLLKKYLLFILLCCFLQNSHAQNRPYIQILGITQDGGYPHMGCTKKCCAMVWANDSLRRYVVSFALVDPEMKKWWLFEATPDIKEQLHYFRLLTKEQYNYLPDGIFITHAHIGHYTGLMELGREVMNTKAIPVYALSKMKTFLETNGPWSQLVRLHNIVLQQLDTDAALQLSHGIAVEAFTVPHRDEYSETAGFRITTPAKRYLFIPDINKWEKWDRKIVDEVKKVDIAFVDATFYDNTELPNTRTGEVLHPLVSETMDLFETESKITKGKIYFIHFNHTNPALWDAARQAEVIKAGYNITQQGQKF